MRDTGNRDIRMKGWLNRKAPSRQESEKGYCVSLMTILKNKTKPKKGLLSYFDLPGCKQIKFDKH